MTKEVNYIKEILAFNSSMLTNNLSTGQIALWYALVYINNSCHWEDWFTVSNKTLEMQTGLSKSGIAKAREALKEKGYIEFVDNGTKATSYRINYVYVSDVEESVQESKQDSVQDSVLNSGRESNRDSRLNSSRVGKQVGVQDSVQNSVPLNKINKNKLYITHTPTKNRFHNFPQRDIDIGELEKQLIANIS